MDAIYLNGDNQTPRITLDKEKNIFEFSGTSLPEDVMQFYGPVEDWIDEYAEAPNEKTLLTMKLDYYNTASSKVIFEILSRFNKMYEAGNDVLIEWHYADDDEDMEEAGEEYADLLSVPFTFHDYLSEE